METHPSLADLLCASEEGLESSTSNVDDLARHHLASCPACRTTLDSFESLLAAGRRVRELVKDRDDEAARADRFRRRLRDQSHESPPLSIGTHWWWAAAVVLPLYVVSLYLMLQVEMRVKPQEILHQTVQAERTQTDVQERRIRFEIKSDVRASHQASSLWLVRDVRPAEWPPQDEPGGLARVVQILRKAGVHGPPLSAAAFAAWRQGEGSRRDRVSVTADLWTLQSEGGPGASVRFAELRISRASYRVVGQTWVVDGLGRVEIAELAEPNQSTPTRTRATTADPVAHAPTATSTTTSDRLGEAELQVRLLLHDAELDDALRVSVSNRRIMVDGSVTSREVKRRLTDSLRRVPEVSLEIRTTVPPAAAEGANLRSWVARRFDDARARQSFAPRLRTLARSVERRSLALERLAHRYPRASEHTLSPRVRAELERLVDRHIATLRRDLLELDARFMALVGVTERCSLVDRSPRDWQERATAVQPPMASVLLEIEALLAHDDMPDDPERMVRVARVFASAWNGWCRETSTGGNGASTAR